MSLRGLFLNNPRFWAWAVLGVVLVVGALIGCVVLVTAFKKSLQRWLARDLAEENEQLTHQHQIDQREKHFLRRHLADEREGNHSATAKVLEGVRTILTAYGIQAPGSLTGVLDEAYIDLERTK